MKREKLRAPEEVLLNVLRRPDDLDALRELRQRAAEIRHHLEDSNLDVSAHDAELRAHPDWLAKVYDALGDEPEQPVLVEWPYHAELQQVGAAFENVLLPGLPTTLEKLVFVDELTEHAAVAPSVMEQVAAHPSGEIVTRALRQRLARVGLCPMSFLLGADAVADTIDRYLDYGLIASQGAVAVEISEVGFVVGDKLTAAQLTAEIGLRTECPTATSRGLHAWLSQAVRYKPKMLVGFAAAADDGGLLLTRAPRASQRDLFVDWQSSELGLGASAGATGVSRG